VKGLVVDDQYTVVEHEPTGQRTKIREQERRSQPQRSLRNRWRVGGWFSFGGGSLHLLSTKAARTAHRGSLAVMGTCKTRWSTHPLQSRLGKVSPKNQKYHTARLDPAVGTAAESASLR